jgi:hypothetical protein
LLAALEDLPPGSAGAAAERILEHSLVYAMIEIGDSKATAEGLKSKHPVVQGAALVALDQMPNGGLTAPTVTPLLAASDTELRRTAGWIVGRHPEWADALVDYLAGRLAAEGLSADDQTELATQLGTFAESGRIQELLATRLAEKETTLDQRRIVLAAMARSGMKEIPAAWIAGLAQVIGAADPALRGDAIATIRALPIAKAAAGPLTEALTQLATREEVGEADRLTLLAAVPGVSIPSLPPPSTCCWLSLTQTTRARARRRWKGSPRRTSRPTNSRRSRRSYLPPVRWRSIACCRLSSNRPTTRSA